MEMHQVRHFELEQTPLKLGVMCTIGPGNFVGLLTNLQAQHSRARNASGMH